jgi:hypothetical protein
LEASQQCWQAQAKERFHTSAPSCLPCDLRERSHLLQEHFGGVASRDHDIWRVAELVWKDLPSSEIAKGFVLAYRVLEKVFKFVFKSGGAKN